jgi:hypothetical protein
MTNILLPYVRNWKTTLTGISMIAGGVASIVNHILRASDGEPLTFESIQIELSTIAIGAGFILSRDADKSSQDSGIR